jgi:hypothetical protein
MGIHFYSPMKDYIHISWLTKSEETQIQNTKKKAEEMHHVSLKFSK